MSNPPTISETDLNLLRRAIQISAEARAHGNHPFGALLADADGNIIAEAENTVITDHDVTGHAELNLVRLASGSVPADVLSSATLYTSTEPCAMCAGAIYWSGVSRVIFGLSESGLAQMTGGDAENPTLSLSVRDVLNAGQREIEVVGPLLEEEAAAIHEGFWDPDRTSRIGS